MHTPSSSHGFVTTTTRSVESRTRRRACSAAAAARRLIALTLALAALGGCHRKRPATPEEARRAQDAALLRQSTITVLRTGGLAGLETEATVDGAKMTYATVTRRACATGQSCPPPTDIASGAITQAAALDLFARIEAEGIFGLREDYGTSPKLRDGFVHVVTLRRGPRTKTIRGDDATQPPELARIQAAVLETIRRARGK
jgi:hypothetical protein